MHYSDTGTLIKPLWGQLFNPLQILLIPLSTHPHIFVLTTNIIKERLGQKARLASKQEAQNSADLHHRVSLP